MISVYGYGGKIKDITKKKSNKSSFESHAVNKYRKQIKYILYLISPLLKELYLVYARRRSGVFIVNFEHISHLVLVFLLLTLNK